MKIEKFLALLDAVVGAPPDAGLQYHDCDGSIATALRLWANLNGHEVVRFKTKCSEGVEVKIGTCTVIVHDARNYAWRPTDGSVPA